VNGGWRCASDGNHGHDTVVVRRLVACKSEERKIMTSVISKAVHDLCKYILLFDLLPPNNSVKQPPQPVVE
jgi:hypothetical protein